MELMMTRRQRTLRAVWAAYTATPHASHREIAQRLRIGLDTVRLAKQELASYGYIDYAPGQARATRVVVPFHVGGNNE